MTGQPLGLRGQPVCTKWAGVITAASAEATLVLVGHGSMQHSASMAPVCQHAAELRRRGCFREVAEAFWLVEPKLDRVISRVATDKVFVLPLFISEGYFTEEVIPTTLGLTAPGEKLGTRIRRVNGRLIRYCQPVGTHQRMTEVVVARALGALATAPFPRSPQAQQVTLALVGHGTGRNDRSRQAVERQAEWLRARKFFAAVITGFMEEAPAIADVYASAPTRDLVVVPFFISDGLHVSRDIPMLLGEPERAVRERLAQGRPAWRNPTERRGRRVWYTPSVGTAPVLAEVILERVAEAAAWSE